MTAMDILEALGKTQEDLLIGCDEIFGAGEDGALPRNGGKKKASTPLVTLSKWKYRRPAVGFVAAAAILLLICVGGGAFVSRTFVSRSFDSANSTGSTAAQSAESAEESAEIAADTAEESAVEETGVVETEETARTTEETDEEEGAALTSSAEDSTESAALPVLQLGEVYIPGFASSALSDEEYAEWMELAALVQEEIDDALSQEICETLPVYRFTYAEEHEEGREEASDNADVNQIEKVGDYPVITAKEAEELLRQGYYFTSADFSEEDIDSVEAVSLTPQYLISAVTQIYMPYYQFDVVVDGDMVFECCVPAISQEYLETS